MPFVIYSYTHIFNTNEHTYTYMHNVQYYGIKKLWKDRNN